MSNTSNISYTAYQDIYEVLSRLSQGVEIALLKNLVGLYRFGSLSYGDFRLGSSDIDLVAIVQKALNPEELVRIKQLHKEIGELNIKWLDSLECSYTPLSTIFGFESLSYFIYGHTRCYLQ